jgi:hypothetical protein
MPRFNSKLATYLVLNNQALNDLLQNGMAYCDRTKAGTIITGAIKNSSDAKILTELGWTTLSERRNYLQACLMYKIVNGLSPLYLLNLILNRRPAHQLRMNLRNADNLPVPRFRMKTFEINFKVSGIRLWNTLSHSIHNCSTIGSFKHNYKIAHLPKGRPELGFGNRRDVQLLCRFRLSYTTLNDDLGRRKIVPSRLCPCGLANESYIHYFFDCRKYNESRRKLYNSLARLLDVTTVNLTAMSRAVLLSIILYGIEGDRTKSSCILKFTHVFISESNRF